MLNFVNYAQIALNFLVFAMRRLQKSVRKGRKKAGTRRRGTRLGGRTADVDILQSGSLSLSLRKALLVNKIEKALILRRKSIAFTM